MTLREETFYLRLSTYQDLIDDATHLELLERLQELNHGPFQHYQDVLARGRPKPVTGELLMERLHRMVGEGLHQVARFRLWSQGAPVVRSFELNAHAHPYSGRFVTQVDIRLERSWLARNRRPALERTSRLFEELVQMTTPFQGHVHDTDDNSIQNIGQASLLRNGYGLEVQDDVELASNPGREISRGELRYCVNWLTALGPELIERLGGAGVVETAPASTVRALDVDWEARPVLRGTLADRDRDDRPEPRWLLLALDGDPLEPDGAMRQAQGLVREHLGLARLAHAERYNLGYWQRKA